MKKRFYTKVLLTLICLFTNSLALADESADLRSLKAAHNSFSNLATSLDAVEFGRVLGDKLLFNSHNTVVPIYFPTKDAAVNFFSTVIFGPKKKGEFSLNSRLVNYTVSGNTGLVYGILQVRTGRGGYLRVMEVWAKDDGDWKLIVYNEINSWGPEGKLEGLERRLERPNDPGDPGRKQES